MRPRYALTKYILDWVQERGHELTAERLAELLPTAKVAELRRLLRRV